MRRKILTVIVATALVVLCMGASCRQETAQSVIATFLNTLAETAAQELVKGSPKRLSAVEWSVTTEEAE